MYVYIYDEKCLQYDDHLHRYSIAIFNQSARDLLDKIYYLIFFEIVR